MATKKKLLQAAAGTAAAGGAGLNVEEVFSTYLYEGNSSTQTITNDIDLSGEGGLVWTKVRTQSENHYFWDTERGVNKRISPNTYFGEGTETTALTSFNSNGFTLGSHITVNGSSSDWGGAADYCSWTFRKAPKFFDVVTWTGDGTTNHSKVITHNLGSSIGFIAVKGTTNTFDWQCAHRSLSVGQTLKLNATNAASGGDAVRIVDDTSFSVAYNAANQSGQTYVAYLFAHNDGDGDFGPDGDADIIKCGSYTGNGSTTGPEIDLGFEPQWIMIKSSSNIRDWLIFDNMRGIVTGGNDPFLIANGSVAEEDSPRIRLTPTGFQPDEVSSDTNNNGYEYIYIAIRRGPMSVPTDATDVFAIDRNDQTAPTYEGGFPVDMGLIKRVDNANSWLLADRLRGESYLVPNATDAESTNSSMVFDYMEGWNSFGSSSAYYSWMWKRAPSFCDVVAYTGNGTAGRTVSHNLGVAPEMMWVKKRNASGSIWAVFHKDVGATKFLRLNTTDGEVTLTALWNDTAPTSDVFTVGAGGSVNNSGDTFIAYLFATLDGVSKVGSYTGTGSSQTIDCGFSSGARFVLLKRSSGVEDWTIFDSVRGITTGTSDPLLILNGADAEYTENFFYGGNVIEPHSSGFTVKNYFATNGRTYIFYAIA